MKEKTRDFDVTLEQPLPFELRAKLPINYFLFVEVNQEAVKHSRIMTTVSTFHNTGTYCVYPYYKSISNIL